MTLRQTPSPPCVWLPSRKLLKSEIHMISSQTLSMAALAYLQNVEKLTTGEGVTKDCKVSTHQNKLLAKDALGDSVLL